MFIIYHDTLVILVILDSVDQSDRLTAARSKQRQFLNFSYLYLVTFAEEILNEKLFYLCSKRDSSHYDI